MENNGIGTTTATEVVTTPVAEGAEAGTTEHLTAFQKFMQVIVGDKPDVNKGTAEADKVKAEAEKSKTYTADDLNAQMEAAKAKWQDEQKEKDRLAKLPTEEQEKAQKESTGKKIAELEGKLLQKELRESAVALLSSDGFPVGLADLVNYSSKESMTTSLESTKEIFKTCLAEAINQKLKGTTPAGLGGAAGAENSIEDQIAKNIRGGM